MDIIPDRMTGLYTLAFQNKNDLRWETFLLTFLYYFGGAGTLASWRSSGSSAPTPATPQLTPSSRKARLPSWSWLASGTRRTLSGPSAVSRKSTWPHPAGCEKRNELSKEKRFIPGFIVIVHHTPHCCFCVLSIEDLRTLIRFSPKFCFRLS